MPKHIPRFRQGDELAASPLDTNADQTRRNRVSVAPGSGLGAHQGPAGLSFYDQRPPEFWAKLTAFASGHYTAVEQVRTGAGTWQTGARSVSAIEVNGNTTVPVTGTVYVYVRLHVASNEWVFQAAPC